MSSFGDALPVLGAIAGDAAAGSDRGHSQALTDEAINAIKAAQQPDDIANLTNYQQYQDAGQLTPDQESVINAAPSQAGQVKADPKMLAAQMQALNSLKQLSQTGMSATDKARLNQIQQSAASQAEGQRQQVLQNFAQRGLGGSGNELLAQLQASQNAANQGNQQSLDVAGQAQNAALQALQGYGQQASGIEGQEYNQQAQAANANDLTNRFNTTNQLAQQQRNVASRNQAQASNLQNKQNLMNANTGQSNTALQQQKAGEQDLFNDQLNQGKALSGAEFAGANAYNNMGNQQAQKWTNIGNGLSNMSDSSSIMGMFGGGGGGGAAGGAAAAAAEGGTVPTNQDLQKRQQQGQQQPPQYFAGGGLVDGTVAYPTIQEDSSSGGGGGGGGIMSMLPMLAMLAAHGGSVPGKAPVQGDSYANDKVHILVSPGEIILPRHITMSHNAPELAKLFVENEMRKQGRK